jgi:DNA polymerase III epsilon subunit-like protein
MKILVFDTETTGLLPKDISIYQTNIMPHIVQFSFILYNTTSNKIEMEHDYIIKIPSEISISKESSKIHGITKQKTNKQGYYIKDVLELFVLALNNCDFAVAHNLSFDKKMIMIEAIRCKIKLDFYRNGLNYYCTMKNSIDLCKIDVVNQDGNHYYKFPTLSELHNHLFKVEPNNIHNSFIDILICLRCFYAMIFEKDLCTINKKFNSLIRKSLI